MKKNEGILTAVVIAKNEEERIADCLASLAFADECIVIDNGSTDDTVSIARKHNAKIYEENSHNFSSLRNKGKNVASGIWILYVDADEIVTERLKEEILRTIKQNLQETKFSGYYISRRNYYLGTEWPVRDKMQRLFIKEKLIGWEGELHETGIVNGEIGQLKEPLIHNTHRTLEDMVTKTNEWSAIEAKLRFENHHPPIVWWRFLRVIWTGFFNSFYNGGWKAGTVGWIESIYQGFSMFLTYAKLWEMQEKASKK